MKNNQNERLDQAVFNKGFAESREKSKAFIMAGVVYVNNQKADKPGMTVKESDIIEVRDNPLKYVSRGGLKLEKAMTAFDLKLDGMVCADIGASTGGFTDCMLQNGATKVFAIDVGYGQLAWKLRSDERVVNMERTNFRYVTHNEIPEEIDFASVDVSFISLKIILPVMYELLKENGEAVCLIKPQFEAGREKVGKKGVVRDVNVHIEVIENIVGFAASQKFKVLGLSFSPVKGPEGNIEYLVYLKKTNEITSCEEYIDYAKELAKMSHDELDKKGE